MRFTAENYINKNVPVISNEGTVSTVINLLRENNFDFVDQIYVVDADRNLVGIIKTSKLLPASPSTGISELTEKKVSFVHPETNQEKLATEAIKSNLSSIPVVDLAGKFLGVVPSQTIISILRKEHLQDIHRLVGISHAFTEAKKTATENLVTKVKHRMPWLAVGLFGSIAATFLMSRFEFAFENNIELAFFIPGIVYLADAIGTQSETIAVRSLSLSELSFTKIILNEIGTGFLIGLIFAIVYFIFCLFTFNDLNLAISVSVTILATGSLGTTIGTVLPSILQYFKIDPAFGSGPLATIIQDILSIVIYFLIANWIFLN